MGKLSPNVTAALVFGICFIFALWGHALISKQQTLKAEVQLDLDGQPAMSLYHSHSSSGALRVDVD